ncbi:MAG: hypothetical protein ABIA21_00010 [Candidatus Aenigmatarchaeota archaeon]
MDEQKTVRKVFHRLPASYKKIADIDMERDIRVRLFGKVAEKFDDGILLFDGFSDTKVFVDKELLDGISVGDQVRVFARVMITEHGPDFRSEMIQDMGGIDMNLYNRIFVGGVE